MKAWLVTLLMLSTPAFAQMVEVKDEPASQPATSQPATGKEAAGEYFKARKADPSARRVANDGGATPRYLAIHVGSFFTSQAYKWGRGDQDDPGKLNAGVTYRMGEWVNSMDLAFRFDYTNYEFDNCTGECRARKLSFSGILTFPDSNSRFPLYFGGGLGAGFFIKNLNKESALALDYQLIAGARFLDVFENVGFMVETGLKNHLLLLSDGQFNGVYLNVGTVFAF
jgi:hypothetical protein